MAQQTAELSIHSTDVYLNHTARAVPMADPLPTLKDLGSTATRAYLLQGAGLNEADAVKFILISGFNVVPDCGYSQFGVATAYNEASGYYLAAAVLAGG